jgi:hypothetical protein
MCGNIAESGSAHRMMNRRTFLCGLTIGKPATPCTAPAQEPGKVYRLGHCQNFRDSHAIHTLSDGLAVDRVAIAKEIRAESSGKASTICRTVQTTAVGRYQEGGAARQGRLKCSPFWTAHRGGVTFGGRPHGEHASACSGPAACQSEDSDQRRCTTCPQQFTNHIIRSRPSGRHHAFGRTSAVPQLGHRIGPARAKRLSSTVALLS